MRAPQSLVPFRGRASLRVLSCAALALAAALLAGCGGGGEDEEGPRPFVPQECEKDPARCK